MRRVRDREPFAGALIALGQRAGQMFAFVMSDSPAAGTHFVHLEEKHRNMIRQLSGLHWKFVGWSRVPPWARAGRGAAPGPYAICAGRELLLRRPTLPAMGPPRAS